MKGSVLLQNNGYGHTTIASPFLCTAKHIRAYFVNGTLPPIGTVCESVTGTLPFAFNGDYFGVVSPLGNVTKSNADAPVNDDDIALFKAVMGFGKSVATRKTGKRAQ